MSTSLITTILKIESEAEALLAKAGQEAEEVVAKARKQAKTASEAAAESVKAEIAQMEKKASEDKARKLQDLAAGGAAALADITSISEATYQKGVDHIMQALNK